MCWEITTILGSGGSEDNQNLKRGLSTEIYSDKTKLCAEEKILVVGSGGSGGGGVATGT